MVWELPEFIPLGARDRSKWPRCLLWCGWLLGLSAAGERAPWAASLGQLADSSLELALGAYTVDSVDFWTPPEYWDAEDLSMENGDHPCVWTDGSLEPYPQAGFSVAGAGVYLPAPELAMQGAVWGVVEEHGDASLERCRALMSVPHPLQTVQRAEFWGTILALQALWPGHLEVDNLDVSRLLLGCSIMVPSPCLWLRMWILLLLFSK